MTDPIAEAQRLGAEAGKAAASWCFDGNTPESTYRATLQGIEDGDPMILDTFPFCDLSGQWADVPSGPQVLAEILDRDISDSDDGDTEILDAYEAAYNDAAADEIERMARYQLTCGSTLPGPLDQPGIFAPCKLELGHEGAHKG